MTKKLMPLINVDAEI